MNAKLCPINVGLHYNKKCLLQKKKKNRCNNIEIIAIVYEKCCNKIWGNKFVLQKIFVTINLKYFNENFDVIIYLLLTKIIWVQIIAMVYLL